MTSTLARVLQRTSLAGVLLLAACGSDGGAQTGATSGSSTTGATSGTTAGGTAANDPAGGTAANDLAGRTTVVTGAQWTSNVTITVDGANFRFASNGLPSHEVLDTYLADGRNGKYVAGGVVATPVSVTIPIVPVNASSPGTTGNGAIGVSISGAVFFDPYEGNGSSTVANDDNSTIGGVPFIDACGGHPLPNATTYHYHGIPFCVTDAVDTAGSHSVIIGYMFDGYPVYGPQDVGGAEPTNLDACMGHIGATPEFAGDTYHYHVSSKANYISECLKGQVTSRR